MDARAFDRCKQLLLAKRQELSSGIDSGLMGHVQQLQNDEGLTLELASAVNSADFIQGRGGAWLADQAQRGWGDGTQRAIK